MSKEVTYRLQILVTKEQRTRLKIEAGKLDITVTQYILQTLGLRPEKKD